MILEHIAIWTNELERLREYYITHFDAKSNEGYFNPSTNFRSYFLTFESGAQLEIMTKSGIPDNANDTVIAQHIGIIHLAFGVSSMKEVELKAKELEEAGYLILRGPRKTGDGYYEIETLDPDNNRIEVTAKYVE